MLSRGHSPDISDPYWNRYLETIPREELDQLHLHRTRELIRYAYQYSPMYRKLYDRVGLRPDDINSLQEFIERVPSIDKTDLLKAQAANPPYGDLLARLPTTSSYQCFLSSGSTGVPLNVPYTMDQMIGSAEHVATLCWSVGVRPGDTMYLAFNFGIFVGFWMAYLAAFRLGVHVVSGGGVDTMTRLKQIRDFRPTMLVATPTYALHMAEVAKGIGFDLASSSIRFVFVAGEAGASIPSTRSAIESAWGAKVSEFYGTSETGALAQGCPVQGRIHAFEQGVFPLVLDDQGDHVADGEVGELVVTSFIATAQPIIKYRTHDLVRLYSGGCECGRTWKYFEGGILGRTDNMITIKGVNVFPTAVEALLAEVGGTSEHFEMHVWREEALDEIMVTVEASRDLDHSCYASVAARAEVFLRDRVRVRIPVQVLSPGSLPRYEHKAKRFFDHRKTGTLPPHLGDGYRS